jgi:hypothetical protein
VKDLVDVEHKLLIDRTIKAVLVPDLGDLLGGGVVAGGSAGTTRINRNVKIISPNSDGIADNTRRKMKRNTGLALVRR